VSYMLNKIAVTFNDGTKRSWAKNKISSTAIFISMESVFVVVTDQYNKREYFPASTIAHIETEEEWA